MTENSEPAARPPRHPGTTSLLRWFEHDHLQPDLQAISKPFSDLAHGLTALLPDSAELTTALRKLLEAKDCAVRAAIDAARQYGATDV